MKFSWPKGLAPGIKKLLSRYQYVLLVLAAGVLLLLLPLGGGEEEDHTQTPAQLQEEFDLEAFEDRLAGALSQIQGAGEAQVVLTLKSGSRQVLAQDTQRGADGDSSSATVTLGRGSGSQEVVPLQTLAPQFQGALVVCPGGGDPEVCLQIIQAVSALTGLGSNRISVCPSQ